MSSSESESLLAAASPPFSRAARFSSRSLTRLIFSRSFCFCLQSTDGQIRHCLRGRTVCCVSSPCALRTRHRAAQSSLHTPFRLPRDRQLVSCTPNVPFPSYGCCDRCETLDCRRRPMNLYVLLCTPCSSNVHSSLTDNVANEVRRWLGRHVASRSVGNFHRFILRNRWW